MKIYNIEKGVFNDIPNDGVVPDGWYRVESEEVLNKISESLTNGGAVWIDRGKLKTSGKAPSPYHEWQNKKWVINHEQQQAVISAEKSAKLAEINQKAQAFINELAEYDKTPAFERDTWPIQRDEAFAWFADKNAKTPTLDLIALSRGVPVDTLRQKAYEKAIAYQQVAAIVSGQRQAYEDKLNAAETLEQVQAIEPVYQLLQGESR
ncbi:hypothetical protein PTQ27_09425 [Mannheimia sp. AT1]|uniref:Tail fiber assembly protein n=1 Tax=Mannheimia cairinae TaxID=3025936 RepID=A0ABT5MUX3_9PAST|nr:hypothetical protein [Mannheimia cairinae]MDD0824678.1 hypothetical protein [Mannheimia cairinae]MDD0826393.1 hypothetical protein [Mannheimia cairinae]